MDLIGQLETLEQEGLVRRADEIEPAYLFKHALTQQSVYSSLLRQDRRILHSTIGDLYETFPPEQPDDNLLVLAYHFGEAGDNKRASGFLKRYGERATQISAFPEAIQAFERALAQVPAEAAAERSDLYLQLGDTYCRFTNYQVAKGSYEAALGLATLAADPSRAASALSGLGRVAGLQGEHHLARELGERALEAAHSANNAEAIARSHRQLGVSYNFEGNNVLAKAHLEAALESYRRLGDADGIGSALNSLGVIAREDHELERAVAYFKEALELSQARGDKYATGARLNNLGVLAEQRGDFDSAIRFQEQAHALALEIGDREGAALCEINLASLALTRGEITHALQHIKNALSELMALNAISYALYAIAAYAKWQVARAHLERGAELLGLALRHPSSTADIEFDFASVVSRLEQKLGNQALEAAMTRGSQMNLRQTVRELLARED